MNPAIYLRDREGNISCIPAVFGSNLLIVDYVFLRLCSRQEVVKVVKHSRNFGRRSSGDGYYSTRTEARSFPNSREFEIVHPSQMKGRMFSIDSCDDPLFAHLLMGNPVKDYDFSKYKKGKLVLVYDCASNGHE